MPQRHPNTALILPNLLTARQVSQAKGIRSSSPKMLPAQRTHAYDRNYQLQKTDQLEIPLFEREVGKTSPLKGIEIAC